MRILSTIALAVLAFAASAQSYTITGKTGEASNGKKAYLIDQNTAKACDSCVIKDGAFKFENKISGEKAFEVNSATISVNAVIRLIKKALVNLERYRVLLFTGKVKVR